VSADGEATPLDVSESGHAGRRGRKLAGGRFKLYGAGCGARYTELLRLPHRARARRMRRPRDGKVFRSVETGERVARLDSLRRA
jgi:hypothetical protein